jgi:hypothetical protein
MDNKIMVINGNELTIKEYNGQRVITLWDIARLHNDDVRNIRKNFENNKEYLTEEEDYYVIEKQDAFAVDLIHSKEIEYHALNAVKNIPIFTESGYLMMVKPMTGKLAWAVQKQLVKNYFAIREVKQVAQKAMMSLELAADQARFITDLAKAVGISIESQILCVKELYRHAGMELPIEVPMDQKLYDLETIAKRLGIMSENGKPHANAVSAIIKHIDIPGTIKLDVLETNGKWTGSVTKYKEDIFVYVHRWLKENGQPTVIESNNRRFKVFYNKVG